MFRGHEEMIETWGVISVDWRIPKNCFEFQDEVYTSPYIPLSDSCWALRFGISDGIHFCYQLMRCDSGPAKTIGFTLGIRKTDGTKRVIHNERSRTFTNEDNFYRDFPRLKKDQLMKKQSELAPSGMLTLTITLRNEAHHSLSASLFTRLWNLSNSLRDILARKERTDVVLEVERHPKAAHRVILESRSPVFKGMLATTDTDDESKSGLIQVVEGDEKALDVVLSYMYCGVPTSLSHENACSVYAAACKYQLFGLKKLCCEFVVKNFSVDSICDVIEEADSYKATGLLELAKDYFVENLTEIVKTQKWNAFKMRNLALVPELIECIARKNAPEKGPIAT